MPKFGVVVMSYGTPSSLDEVEAYYTHIRRGRPPTADEVEDLRHRYESIGGTSPLAERTEAQRAAIAANLDARAPSSFRFVCVHGSKHAPPFIEDAITALTSEHVDAIVGLVLAPHYSSASVGEYHERARKAAGATPYLPIQSWHLEPAFLNFQAEAIRRLRQTMPKRHKLVFTAHSLPERVLEDDPYPAQLYESASAIATRLRLAPYGDWGLAWQSAARTPERWRGPDIVTVIENLAATGRADGILVCPQGFVADHLEVLYDLDVVAAEAATTAGLRFARTEVVNDDPAVMAALADRIIARSVETSARDVDERPITAPEGRPRHPINIVVVGGGITGLTTAHSVLRDIPGARVSVIESADRLGGKIKTTAFAGKPVDCGADAFLARVPDAVDLCVELGLGDDLVTPAQRSAYLYVDGALRRFPENTVLGIPLDFEALEASGVLTADGLARAEQELELPPEQWPPPGTTDETVGALVRRRLGDEVLERLVGPLLGGVNCGSADELSVTAGAPQFAAAMREHGSLIEGLRALRDASSADPESPVFYGLVGGTQSLTDALAASIVEQGGSIFTGATVRTLHAGWLPGRTTPLYSLRLDRSGNTCELHADVVVLTVPDYETARLLGGIAPDFAGDLAAVDYASAVLVTMAVPKASIDHPLDGSGFLVAEREGLLLTACSWASSKWAHLNDPEIAILRASAGRTTDTRALAMEDDLLINALASDLAATMGLRGEPDSVRVSRWPNSLPQFRPGHLDRMRAGAAALANGFPGLYVAGAGVGGLGVPACIAQGNLIASTIADLGFSPREPVKGANQPQH